MAKKNKTKQGKKSSRRSGKRSKGRKSGRRAAKSSPIGKAFKDGLIVGAGALAGALLETTGMVPKGISAPAIGILAAGVAMTGGRRMPSAVILAAAVGTQAFKTVSETEKFATLEAKFKNAVASGDAPRLVGAKG